MSAPRRRPARGSGRRPGNPGTRGQVLAAAREAFAEKGFDGATIRGIAATAGVDPALVHHHFGTKDALFLAAVEAPIDPEELLPEVLDADPAERGEKIIALLLRIWDGPMQPAGLALVRSAVANECSARLLREFVMTRVLRRVVATIGAPPAERELRGALLCSQLVGLVMTRYVVRLEPLTSADPATLVATIGPTLQRYLTGELPPLTGLDVNRPDFDRGRGNGTDR